MQVLLDYEIQSLQTCKTLDLIHFTYNQCNKLSHHGLTGGYPISEHSDKEHTEL